MGREFEPAPLQEESASGRRRKRARVPKRRLDDERGNDSSARRHVYLVLDDWAWGYSIRKLSLPPPAAVTAEDAAAAAAVGRLRSAPAAVFHMEAPRELPMYFTCAFGSTIVVSGHAPRGKTGTGTENRIRIQPRGPGLLRRPRAGALLRPTPPRAPQLLPLRRPRRRRQALRHVRLLPGAPQPAIRIIPELVVDRSRTRPSTSIPRCASSPPLCTPTGEPSSSAPLLPRPPTVSSAWNRRTRTRRRTGG